MRTVLLVEDNAGDATLVREALQARAPEIDLRWVKRLDEGLMELADVDVILLDLSLPDSAGIDTVRRWRRGAPDLPVVVLTGNDDDGVARQALLEGAQDFLAKTDASEGILARVLRHAFDRHAILRRLERNRDELAQAVAMRDEILATATHELRSPLTVLLGVASMLGERGEVISQDRRRELLDTVSRQTSRLQELVDDLIELAQHQGAGAPAQPSRVQVAGLVHRAIGDAVGDISLVRTEVPAVGWVTDAGWVRRILVNLLSNAQKYGEPPIVVTAEVDGGRLRITVRDHGPGVPDDVLPVLFEPFTRGASTRSRPGSGLGLAIVARLAEGLGGTIAYEPDADGGAGFVLDLPSLERRS